MKLEIENKLNYLEELEELQNTIQDHWETCYCDKDTNYDSDNKESEDQKKKIHAFNV